MGAFWHWAARARIGGSAPALRSAALVMATAVHFKLAPRLSHGTIRGLRGLKACSPKPLAPRCVAAPQPRTAASMARLRLALVCAALCVAAQPVCASLLISSLTSADADDGGVVITAGLEDNAAVATLSLEYVTLCTTLPTTAASEVAPLRRLSMSPVAELAGGWRATIPVDDPDSGRLRDGSLVRFAVVARDARGAELGRRPSSVDATGERIYRGHVVNYAAIANASNVPPLFWYTDDIERAKGDEATPGSAEGRRGSPGGNLPPRASTRIVTAASRAPSCPAPARSREPAGAVSHVGVRERGCRKGHSCRPCRPARVQQHFHISTLHARACLTQPRVLPADLHRVHGRAAAQLHGRTRHAGWLQSASRCHWCHLVWVVQLCNRVCNHGTQSANASAGLRAPRRSSRRAGEAMPGTAAPLARSTVSGGRALLCAALGRSRHAVRKPARHGARRRAGLSAAHRATSHSLGFSRTWLVDHPTEAAPWLVSWLALATAIHSLELAD